MTSYKMNEFNLKYEMLIFQYAMDFEWK
jgi:hypothetical protein